MPQAALTYRSQPAALARSQPGRPSKEMHGHVAERFLRHVLELDMVDCSLHHGTALRQAQYGTLLAQPATQANASLFCMQVPPSPPGLLLP